MSLYSPTQTFSIILPTIHVYESQLWTRNELFSLSQFQPANPQKYPDSRRIISHSVAIPLWEFILFVITYCRYLWMFNFFQNKYTQIYNHWKLRIHPWWNDFEKIIILVRFTTQISFKRYIFASDSFVNLCTEIYQE